MHNGDQFEHGERLRRPHDAPPPYEEMAQQGERNQRGEVRRGGRQGYHARGTVGGRNRRRHQAYYVPEIEPEPVGPGEDEREEGPRENVQAVRDQYHHEQIPNPEARDREDNERRVDENDRAEIWHDLEDRVFGHLRRFTGGIQRFPETIASLEQKGHAYVAEHLRNIEDDHPIHLAEVVSRAAIRALAAGAQGRALLDMYGNRTIMQEIDELNRGITSMTDPRRRVGWGWYAMAGVAAAAGIGAFAKGKTIVGTAILATAATATASLLWRSKAPSINNAWKNAWRLP